ncbi:MAG: hypothetical protein ACOC2H_02840 [Spirochaetota bacterium]
MNNRTVWGLLAGIGFCMVFLLVLYTASRSIYAQSGEPNSVRAIERYTLLLDAYYHWTENFYGADRFYYRTVRSLVHDFSGKEFATPGVFMNISRAEYYHRTSSDFVFSSWLTILTPDDEEAVRRFVDTLSADEEMLGVLISVSGTVTGFSVDERFKTVTLRLESVTVRRVAETEQ